MLSELLELRVGIKNIQENVTFKTNNGKQFNKHQ